MVINERNSTALTTSDIAHLLNLHINTVRRWSDNGIIRSHRIGPRSDRIFYWDDITHLLKEHKVKKR